MLTWPGSGCGSNFDETKSTTLVPKCEIFNLSDSRYLYTIKPSRAADFGTVIKIRNCFVLVMISKFFE
jgi:hypothetical protein